MENDINAHKVSKNDPAIWQVIDTMDYNQKKVLYYLVEKALQSKGKANTLDDLLNMSACESCPYKEFFDKMKERINKLHSDINKEK